MTLGWYQGRVQSPTCSSTGNWHVPGAAVMQRAVRKNSILQVVLTTSTISWLKGVGRSRPRNLRQKSKASYWQGIPKTSATGTSAFRDLSKENQAAVGRKASGQHRADQHRGLQGTGGWGPPPLPWTRNPRRPMLHHSRAKLTTEEKVTTRKCPLFES